MRGGGVHRVIRVADPTNISRSSNCATHSWQVGPFIGGLGYVVAILVQRKFPRLFAFAYFGAPSFRFRRRCCF